MLVVIQSQHSVVVARKVIIILSSLPDNPTENTFVYLPVGLVEGPVVLTGHHDEGGGEPVLLEHLTLGTDEGEVEANRRSGSHVCNKKALSLPCM